MIGPVIVDVPDSGAPVSYGGRTLTNWIPDVNKFNLREPSDWWLRLLWAYDPNLVVIPSRMQPCYRLCRRLERGKGFNPNFPHEHPDTKMMIHYGLLPIRSIVPWAVQSDKIIRDLMACDLDLHGGAEKVCDRLEAQELDDERKADEYIDAESGVVGRQAYASLKYRTGQRVSLAHQHRGREGSRSHTSRAASAGTGGIILADR